MRSDDEERPNDDFLQEGWVPSTVLPHPRGMTKGKHIHRRDATAICYTRSVGQVTEKRPAFREPLPVLATRFPSRLDAISRARALSARSRLL